MTVLFIVLAAVVVSTIMSCAIFLFKGEAEELILSDVVKKEIQSRPIKTVVGPSFTNIREVLDYYLQSPPEGCLWDVSKVVKRYPDTSNRKFEMGTFARIALLAPHGEVSPFTLLLKDTPDRLKLFEQELKNNIKITLDNYQQFLDKTAAQKDIDDKWDGVYRKDML